MALFDRFSNSDNSEMTFIDHLEVLRGTIVRSLSAVLIASLVLFIYRDWIMDNVITGPINPDFITYRIFCQLSHFLHLGDSLCMPPVKVSMQSTTFGGQFLSSISMSLIGGLIIAFPYIFWEFWRFIRPALTDKELSRTRGVIFWVSLLFFTGVAFGYFLIAPYTVNFFAAYTLSPDIQNTFTVSNYIDNIVSLVLGTGIVFQLPLVVYFLAKVGIVTASFLRTYRKWVVKIGIGAPVTVGDMDVAVEPIGIYSRRVTGMPVLNHLRTDNLLLLFD